MRDENNNPNRKSRWVEAADNISGVPISAQIPTNGQVLVFQNGMWRPTNVGGSGGIYTNPERESRTDSINPQYTPVYPDWDVSARGHELFRNGILQELNHDYTVMAGIIILGIAPQTTERLTLVYRRTSN